MLHLYRASAGSGKTFRLTQHYLQMLFEDASADAHRHILAVTFTNKATDEMKLRIVNELYQLARGLHSHFREDFMQRYAQSAEQINQRAEQLLKEILHDYSFFAVSTIDRFFQQVLRNFAREMSLHGGYSIEIDTDEVLEKAIGDLLSTLDEKEDRQLFEWLMRLTIHQIEEGKHWDLTFQLRRLANELLKENFKKKLPLVKVQLSDKKFLTSYQNMLHKMISGFEKAVSEEAQRANQIMQQYGLSVSDFKKKTRSPFGYFIKYANKEIDEKPKDSFKRLYNQIEEWRKDDSPKKAMIEAAYAGGLNAAVGAVLALFDNHYRAYATAKVIMNQLFALGILMDLDQQIQLDSKETHRLLITETSELLSKIIDGSDTPFVLEKIGVHLHHLLLDEFQDTSDLQWHNFRPLLNNSLSSGYDNLIVGDVKQSIYRWRNSNWELLDQQLFEDFPREQIQESFLNENWRSARSVIHFNNLFFTLASNQLQEQINRLLPFDFEKNERLDPLKDKILHAYKELKQSYPDSAPVGNVTIQFYANESKDQSFVLSQLVEWVEKLQDMGYQPGDMAVLVRRNEDAAVIVNYFLHYQNSDQKKTGYSYEMLSDEALVIGNATSVQLLILLLRYLLQPDESILRAKMAMTYFQLSHGMSSGDEVTAFFNPDQQQQQDFEAFEKKVVQCANEARNSSLFELTEAFIHLLPPDGVNKEALFIQAFQDWVYHFSVTDPKGIDGFLSWWDETGYKKLVPAPELTNAIRVMTVHKSKGLGFKVVFIPFTDWKLDQKETILWCEPHEAPFDQLPLVPIRYASKLQDTIFDVDYLEEKAAAMIDSLNVTYVAMTRAKEMLVVFAPLPAKTKNDDILSLSSLLYQIVTDQHDAFDPQKQTPSDDFPCVWDESLLRFTLGEVSHAQGSSTIESSKTVDYLYHSQSGEKPVLSVKRYARNVWDVVENQGIESNLNYGILMHDVLRRIHSRDDSRFVLNDLEREGHITEQEKAAIEEMLVDFWSIPETSQWFDPAFRSRNELPILTPEGESYIPDRVVFSHNEVLVVDYKFGTYRASHRHQVLTYKKLIESMGYQVSAFLCYVPEKNVLPVVALDDHEQLSLFER